MLTKSVSIQEAQDHLKELITRASHGEEIVISEGTKPLAKIISIETSKKQRKAGLQKGKVNINESFDNSLPDAFWLGQ